MAHKLLAGSDRCSLCGMVLPFFDQEGAYKPCPAVQLHTKIETSLVTNASRVEQTNASYNMSQNCHDVDGFQLDSSSIANPNQLSQMLAVITSMNKEDYSKICQCGYLCLSVYTCTSFIQNFSLSL